VVAEDRHFHDPVLEEGFAGRGSADEAVVVDADEVELGHEGRLDDAAAVDTHTEQAQRNGSLSRITPLILPGGLPCGYSPIQLPTACSLHQ
jgi:hypothetical protein